ncbi:DUF6059 family protein [Actinomadura fibrosa]|uniref:DUF6059 family protein n=1 Tax=Actinomadura fibrosa TaxID=111802 RepID=A0ABW2XQ54_9ACTN|nr:DUF6059 family protein [Actinomadura fibrosa]
MNGRAARARRATGRVLRELWKQTGVIAVLMSGEDTAIRYAMSPAARRVPEAVPDPPPAADPPPGHPERLVAAHRPSGQERALWADILGRDIDGD